MLILASLLGYNILPKIQHKNKIVETLKTIPEFYFQTLDGSSYSSKDIKRGLNTIFIYFNSECDYCQHEALSIKENISSFRNTQLIFISPEDKKTIRKFSSKHELDTYDFVIFLQDTHDVFSERFDANSIPYILIYDKNKNLVKKHKGQLNSKALLNFLE